MTTPYSPPGTTTDPGTAIDIDATWFDSFYDAASRTNDATAVPWVHDHPNRAMVNWLNAVAPSLVRCGARVAVVACALGDDAAELVHRGYDVTAFDCSERAITWARQRHRNCADCFVQADLFDLPARWGHRFDLVVEVDTLEVIAPDLRARAMESMKRILAMHGHLLVVGRAAREPMAAQDGPPWFMTKDELLVAATAAGLSASDEPSVFEDGTDPATLRMRGLFAHAPA